MRHLFFLLFSLIGVYGFAQDLVTSNQLSTKYIPEVMVVGLFHFGESGDSYSPLYKIDILSEERQQELEQILTKLLAFRPTKILVEFDRIKMDSLLNVQYNQYLQGTFDISQIKNEVYQVGFRLAQMAGHDRIYCSDATAEWFGTNEIDWDTFDEEAYLKSRGQFEKSERYNYETLYAYEDSMSMEWSINERLLFLNNPEINLKLHQVYLTNIVIGGAGDNYYGADSVGKWYRRNLRIFSNICDLATFEKPERVLLLYGASHVWTLRQFIHDSPDFEYVEANSYLK